MKKQIWMIMVLCAFTGVAQAQLDNLKSGNWKSTGVPLINGELVVNALYDIITIEINQDKAEVVLYTLTPSRSHSKELLNLVIGNQFESKTPSGRKVISVLTYDEQSGRFNLDRTVYEGSEKILFIDHEQIWYEKEEMHISRNRETRENTLGFKDFEVTWTYKLQED